MSSIILASLNTVALIFGGCCSNVFTLETIIKTEPDSGLLITFFQFLFTALAAYPSQFDPSGRFTLKSPTVPFQKWVYIAAMFFGVNMLNNWAFAFNISVPVHIILRSFGSVTTMGAGWFRGKRYSWLQITSVAILTAGVLVSAWADARSKGKSMSAKTESSTTDLASGLSILLLAQILSAFMGNYVQDTYAAHGASWRENLFYSHALSLPLFLPLSSTLRRQYARLSATTPIAKSLPYIGSGDDSAFSYLLQDSVGRLPRGIAYLLLNAITQLGCISGVNVLSAQASAVTVTIVLNIRKLVSFIISTVLFGHHLSPLMMFGAAMVFGSGALYGYETSWRIPRAKAAAEKKKKKDGKKVQ